MKRLGAALFLSFSLIWAACACTGSFSLEAVKAPLAAEESPLPSLAVENSLSQPFHYLSQGRQCFVFASADGKYVLKFFNQKYFQVPWYAFFIPKEYSKRAQRRHFYEHSYEIALRELGEEILYLHLGPSHSLPSVVLTDAAGRKSEIDLNYFPFVLQRKGTPFYEGLQASYAQGGLEALCREIDAFMGALSLRIGKNIADGDSDVEHNWGYIDGKIFHLDPGRLFYDDQLQQPARMQKEWQGATRSFHKWLKKHYPDAALYLEKKYADSAIVGKN